jgi:SAM-dependent methyltransferase
MKSAVKRYWEDHPLGSLDINVSSGSQEYFETHNRIYDEECIFSRHLFEFSENAEKLVLDIGCGPGWLVRNYAKGDAKIVGIDLTERAIRLTSESLNIFDLSAKLLVGDAERLPFAENTFDFISCNGVLHHTPDTEAGFRELFRVLKPKGRAIVSLYYRNFLLGPAIFPLTRFVLRLMGVNPSGRSKLTSSTSVEDFVSVYDGNLNPLGKAFDRQEVEILCQQFDLLNVEIHFFPRLFLPCPNLIPNWLYRWLDHRLGTMIYLQLHKPN